VDKSLAIRIKRGIIKSQGVFGDGSANGVGAEMSGGYFKRAALM